VVVSPYDFPSTEIGKPPGFVSILIVPCVALFGFFAKAVEEGCTAQKTIASKMAKANFLNLRCLLKKDVEFDIRLDLRLFDLRL
jgi:hypothetical protein